jgi:hypothetical protein
VFAPVQILNGILDGFMEQTVTLTATERAKLRPSPSVEPLPPERTWLPEIKRFLMTDWIDLGPVTTKAAKGDDATVPTGLLDKRVYLVFQPSRRLYEALPFAGYDNM